MATILIRQLDEKTKAKLHLRAASHGHSMEAEAREILKAAVSVGPAKRSNLAAAIRRHIDPIGGFDLVIPAREVLPRPVDFGE